MDEAEHCDRLGFIYQGRIIAQGTPAAIKAETFRKPVFVVEAPDPRRAAEVLAEWPRAEEAVRYGTTVRLVAADEGLDARAVEDRLRGAGLPAEVAETAPTVEDLFVSFVDRERKVRLREQLRALAARRASGPDA
jgi:ABC-2 type transport system ATP-binding protein